METETFSCVLVYLRCTQFPPGQHTDAILLDPKVLTTVLVTLHHNLEVFGIVVLGHECRSQISNFTERKGRQSALGDGRVEVFDGRVELRVLSSLVSC